MANPIPLLWEYILHIALGVFRDCFYSRNDRDHVADTDWPNNTLFVSDVYMKGGKVYFYYGSERWLAAKRNPDNMREIIDRTYRNDIILVIMGNRLEYPAGNNHGSVCCISNQWYISFYPMKNNTIIRRALGERIEIFHNGTIP